MNLLPLENINQCLPKLNNFDGTRQDNWTDYIMINESRKAASFENLSLQSRCVTGRGEVSRGTHFECLGVYKTFKHLRENFNISQSFSLVGTISVSFCVLIPFLYIIVPEKTAFSSKWQDNKCIDICAVT